MSSRAASVVIAALVALGAARARAEEPPGMTPAAPDGGPPSGGPPGGGPPGASDPTPAPTAPTPTDADGLTDDDRRAMAAATPPPDESDDDSGPPPTGSGHLGVYQDSDQTTVFRALANLGQSWGHWQANGSVGVDVVTSASIDVRSSPLGAVDVVTSASGQSSTSGGQMTDKRLQVTGGTGWNDGSGHAVSLTSAVAAETDYQSVSGGLNGSIDILDRSTTLLGGFSLTDNWISSVLDRTLSEKMFAAEWSAGIARVLTPDDAVRMHYDGKVGDGYLSSPYRNVRFGDWATHTGANQALVFSNTIGSPDGLPEHEPDSRVSHALVLEWVHSLALGVGLHPLVRVSHDDWGLQSLTASLDLRVARPGWQMQLGYRYYLQSGADFFHGKYTMDPSRYAYYTSDKELGDQTGHLVGFQLSKVLRDAERPTDTKLLLDLRADVFHYDYPGFVLLGSRYSTFLELGLTWQL